MFVTNRLVRRGGFVAAACALSVSLGMFAGVAHAGSSDTSAQEWANGVCSAVQNFAESIDSTISGLKSAASIDAAVDDAKTGLDEAAAELEDSFQALGKPATADLKQAQSALANLTDQLTDVVSNVEALLSPPPSTPQEIAATFSQIGSEIQKAVSQTKSTANALKGLKPNGKLQTAFQKSPDCKALKNSV